MGADVDKVDLIVVGGGLAGLACALEAAHGEMAVLLVERGDRCGAKNVTGGRLYVEPVCDLLPEGLLDEAPFERAVTHESLALMAPSSSTTIDFTSESMREASPSSYTLLRSRFDRWLGEKVEEAGGFIVPQAVATELIRQDGRIVGVKAGDEELVADVVVAADGVLSFIAREAGLAPAMAPTGHALGIKEVIKLDPARIEDRFNLLEGEGAARLFLGDLTRKITGGGFLYTNADTISLGLVLSLEDLGGRSPDAIGSHELMEAFKNRSEIKPLVAGGETVEYSAHLIPELHRDALPRRVTDGLILAGDAAGLVLNHGITVRGMDFALASGVLAARAVRHAKKKGDYSASTLGEYDRLLTESFVVKDIDNHATMPEFLANERLYELYPKAVCDILEGLFRVGADGKSKLWPETWKKARESFVNMDGLSDFWAARKL